MSELPSQTSVVVVTGLSGAGKSTALHALEDLGYFCVDNLPPPVAHVALEALERAEVRRVALGIDVRVRSFLEAADVVIEVVQTPQRAMSVLFLDASDQSLLRRFSSTRRPHPLSTVLEPGGAQAAQAVLDGVRIEREKLAALRAKATHLVDTTNLSVHDLRRRVLSEFGPGGGGGARMRTRFISFGFKYGAPVDADLLFDVRFLKNPYFVEELSAHSGLEAPVREFVLGLPDTGEFVERTRALLEYCLPRFEREGKSYVTVAIGCTGGRHRSVVLAEHLASVLREALDPSIAVVHRDVDRVTLDRPSDVTHPGTAESGGSS